MKSEVVSETNPVPGITGCLPQNLWGHNMGKGSGSPGLHLISLPWPIPLNWSCSNSSLLSEFWLLVTSHSMVETVYLYHGYHFFRYLMEEGSHQLNLIPLCFRIWESCNSPGLMFPHQKDLCLLDSLLSGFFAAVLCSLLGSENWYSICLHSICI